MAEKDDLMVPALGRAAAILDLVASEGQPISLSSIARQTGIAKSTVHGLCQSLCALQLLLVEGTGFVIGPRALTWSSSWLRDNDLSRGFARLASQDNGLADYSMTLSILEGRDVVYIGCRNSVRPLGITFRTGMRLPAVMTATGKAMLSMLQPRQREAHIPDVWPKPLTTAGRSDPVGFEDELRHWREIGYALDQGEIREGMTCLGVALHNEEGQVVAGLAISMTEAEARGEDLARLAAHLSRMGKSLIQLL